MAAFNIALDIKKNSLSSVPRHISLALFRGESKAAHGQCHANAEGRLLLQERLAGVVSLS